MSASYANTAVTKCLKTSWLASSLLREEDQRSPHTGTPMWTLSIFPSLWHSERQSDKEFFYHSYMETTGDSLHGISLCFHPKNSSTCAPPPAAHSQVEAEDPEHPTDWHYTIFLSVVREGFNLASPRKFCCSDCTGDDISPAPKELAGPSPSHYRSRTEPTPDPIHPSSAWYHNSGHQHQRWLRQYEPPIRADEECDTTAGQELQQSS